MLVSSVKSLQQLAQHGSQIQMKDKEIEEKLDVVRNVAALGFAMPSNMAISLLQIISQLLSSQKIPPSKDFLVFKALALLAEILSSCKKANILKEVLGHEASHFSILELIKWNLFLVKDRSTAVKVSPDVQVKATEHITALLVVCPHLRKLSQEFLPAISSVCTKAVA